MPPASLHLYIQAVQEQRTNKGGAASERFLLIDLMQSVCVYGCICMSCLFIFASANLRGLRLQHAPMLYMCVFCSSVNSSYMRACLGAL